MAEERADSGRMLTASEIDWGHDGIRLRREPAAASVIPILARDLSVMPTTGDYRDLTIADLADENADLRERLAEAERREVDLRSWGRCYRELARRATAMLARVTYERDIKARQIRSNERQIRSNERQIRQLMGVERYFGDDQEPQEPQSDEDAAA